jgi:hypothetical protein
MEFIVALWLPIVASAVAVFIAGSVIHMVLPHHKTDWKELPDEEAVGKALRDSGAGPGHYMVPWCQTMAEMGGEEMKKKYETGPVGFLTLLPNAVPTMGKNLLHTFLFYLVVSVFVAYLAFETLAEGTGFSRVFQVTGVAAILGHAAALIPGAIWYARGSIAVKDVFDGIAYGLITAAIFGALWP